MTESSLQPEALVQIMFANKRLRPSQKQFKDWAAQTPVEPKWSLSDFRRHIWRKSPNVLTKQDCALGEASRSEAEHGAKLAFLAYTFPWLLTILGPNLDLPNAFFTQLAQKSMAANGFDCFQNMQDILDGDTDFITLPNDTLVSGFFFRTPTRLWRKSPPYDRVYTMPDWEHRHDLLHLHVIGNVNGYVLRRNLLNNEYELILLFRGTSNELHAVPEYGEALSNTQLFHLPDFNVDTGQHSTDEREPLFYHHYYCILMDAMPHFNRLLDVLGADNAKRILCAGHSMGGALVVTFAWMIREHRWWPKFQFRAYAAPYCCNDTAVRLLDQISQDKMIEVVNADDFVNVQYMFGDQKGFDASVQHGTKAVVLWMIKRDKSILLSPTHKEMVARCLRDIQLYPDISLALFLHNVNLEQSERKNGRYTRPKNVIMCKRRVNDSAEYVGKSHSEYLDVDMQVLWKPLRDFEDSHYSWFADVGLKVKQNEFRLVGLFADPDRAKAKEIIETYLVDEWSPPWEALEPKN